MGLRSHILRGLVVLVLILAGCTGTDETTVGAPRPSASGKPGGDGQVLGQVTPASSDPSATPTPQPTKRPDTPSPTPKPTATPRTWSIDSVNVSATTVLLFPPAQDTAVALGYPTSRKLTGEALRSDSLPAPVRWVDRSGGQLSVAVTGQIDTRGSTLPGFYYVRCEAVDDPTVYRDVLVEVRSTSELQVIIR